MEVKELRIGNFVDVLNRNAPVYLPMGCKLKIGEISFFEVKLYEIDKPFATQVIPEPTDIKDLTPIPLTEQHIINFGFKPFVDKNTSALQYEKGDIKMYKNADLSDITLHFKGILIKKIKYIHELQNGYFFLTDMELEWKEA